MTRSSSRDHEKLRILQVVLDLEPGGTQRLVVEMSKRLRWDAEIAVCCLSEPGAWARELSDQGIVVQSLRRRPGFRPSLALKIARQGREHGAQVFHCHHYTPFVYGTLAARLGSGASVVYTEHGRLSDAPPSFRQRLANRLFARLPGCFIAVSEELRSHLIAAGFASKRVAVVYNGIDPGPAPTEEDRRKARRLLELPPEAWVVGSVARLDPVKQLLVLGEAFATIAEEDPSAHLVVIGDGPERPRLLEFFKNAPFGQRVRLTGHREDVRSLLPAFDLYANTSVTEGVSVTILEAMAAGLPVTATAVGGTPEVVADGDTGLLFPARDPAAAAAALERLRRDPDLGEQLGRAGRRRVVRSFSLDRMIEHYLDIYTRASLSTITGLDPQSPE